MKTHTLEQTVSVRQSLVEVFDFFSRAENLERITPPTLSFRILTPSPVEMREGALIDYRIKLMGVSMRWRTLISKWDPPNCFVDEQLKGPYLYWRHTHTFRADGDQTVIQDRVEYRVPGGPFEPLIHGLFVGPRVAQIFAYRETVIGRMFGS